MSYLALAFVAGTIGAMVFFGAVVAPTAFGTLGEENAGPFIRALFPRYYLMFTVSSLLGCATAVAAQATTAAILLALAGAGFIYARQRLMPAINAARDAGLTDRFEVLHRRSVRLNMAQLALLMACAVILPFAA